MMAPETHVGDWQLALPYTLPLLVSGLFSFLIALIAWRRRTIMGALPLVFLSLAAAEWSVAYALEIAFATTPAAIWLARIQYLGIMTLPVAWVLFALTYANLGHRINRRLITGLLAIPLLTQIAVWTNDLHGLIWPSISLNTAGPIPILEFGHGIGFWICNLYAHISLAFGVVILLRAFLQAQGLYLRQVVVFIGGAIAPWLGNGLYVLDLTPWPGLDLSPFGFSLTAGALAFGIFRLRFLNVVPIARDLVFENMSEGVIVIDEHDRLIDMNRTSQRALGRSVAELIGLPIGRVLESWPYLVEYSQRATYGQHEIEADINGLPRVLNINLSPLYDRGARLRGRLIVWHDITALKQTEAMLRERNEELIALQQSLLLAKDEAEAANHAKGAFLAHMSHELRTPLSAIIGFTDLIRLEQRNRTEPLYTEELSAIKASAQHLLTMINNILDLSKIDSGKLELQNEPFAICDVVQHATSIIRPLVAYNDNNLVVECPANIGLMEGDETKVNQVLLNLLSNAAKFTERGTISLRIWKESASVEAVAGADPRSWVIFAISDTGVGIAPEHLSSLFKEFTQVHKTARAKRGGTGLGLAISQHFCRLMGGDITVTSAVNQGTTFTVRLPCSTTGMFLDEFESADSTAEMLQVH